MIEVLHIVGNLDSGGVENLLLSYYKYFDRKIFHWSFIFPADQNREKGIVEKELESLGATIYYMPRKNPHFVKQLVFFNRFLKEHQFDIIHCHLDEFCSFYLGLAKLHGIKHCIAHCHIAHTRRRPIVEFVAFFAKKYLNKVCTRKFACSSDAALFLYKTTKDVFIMRNAIESKKFRYNASLRMQTRKSLGIENEIIIGCVARFYRQKNHRFLINIFSHFSKLENSKLLLVGDGILEDELRNQVKALNIEDKVIFVGSHKNVTPYLNAMDLFVLPSIYEGLGIVYIEAQAMNLLSFATYERVPHEVAISPFMNFISENRTPQQWAEEIHAKMSSTTLLRDMENNFLTDNGYAIENAYKILQDQYMELKNRTI